MDIYKIEGPSKSDICAGIVTYNPDCERLYKCIEAIINQVDSVIIVDNNSNNKREIFEITRYFKEKCAFILNHENLGLAKAMNQEAQEAYKRNYKWILTLDQDTICSQFLIELYEKIMRYNSVGMITCNSIYNKNDIFERPDEAIKEKIDVVEIDRCITGGSLLNIEAWKEIGGFDEQLFIEWVDYDICAALKRSNYKIYNLNYEGIFQIGGKPSEKKIFGKKIIYSSYSGMRRYYQIRNCIYFLRKYRKTGQVSYRWIVRWIWTYFKITILYEEKKMEKIIMLIKGIRDGLTMKISYQNKEVIE